MAQMGFFDLSDRYAKKDSLVEVNAVVQWEGSGQHWSGSGAIFRDAPEEIDALVLGAKWVGRQGDEALSSAVESAIAKIATVLPESRSTEPAETTLFAFAEHPETGANTTIPIREALRHQKKVYMHYTDGNQAETERKVWPVALGYFDHTQLLLAWCELRGGFRRFRVDRIARLVTLDERLPRPRQVLLREWLATST